MGAGGKLDGADAHDVADFAEGFGGLGARFFGTLGQDAAHVGFVGEDVVDALTDGGGDGEDVFGELFLEVAVADGAVGVGIAEVLYDVGGGGELEQ